MQTLDALKRALTSLDGQSYKLYKELEEEWDFGDYTLAIDHA